MLIKYNNYLLCNIKKSFYFIICPTKPHNIYYENDSENRFLFYQKNTEGYVIYFWDLKRKKEIGIERKLNYYNSVENYHIFICHGIIDLFSRKKSKPYDNKILKVFSYIKNYVNQI